VAFVLTFPLRIFSAVLLGLQDLAFLGCLNIISFLISTAITVALVLVGWGLYALAFGWVVGQFIKAGASWWRLRRRFPTVLPKGLPEISWSVTRVRLVSGFWVSLNQIAHVLLNGTEILIIVRFFGPAAVVPYVCTGKLICIVLMVNRGFIERWVGPDQYGGFWLTALLLLSMLLRHWNLTLGYTIFSFGYERRLCVTALIDGTVSIGAVALFVWLYGLIGAPLGMMVGVCLISLPANLTALARESKLSVWELIRPLSAWFVRFVAIILAAGVLARLWSPGTVPLLVATVAATGLVYLLVMFPLALRHPLGMYVRPRLMPLLARVSWLRS